MLILLFLCYSVGISLVAITATGSEPPKNSSTTVYTNGNSSAKGQRMDKNVMQAVDILRDTDIVCFDVDSTVIKEEGIDELAKFCGKGAEVERL